jgi:UPF0755 protein
MRKLILLFAVLLLLTVGAGIWFINGLMPVSANATLKRFVIDKGETASQIGINLSKAKLVKSALAFRIYSQVTQAAKIIKPGSYDLSSNLWAPQIVAKLLAGPTEIWVTIPEGLRREEIGQKFVDGLGLTGKEAENFYNQFLKLTEDREGYLFPDTYLVARDVTPQIVVKMMENTFDKKYATLTTRTTSLSKAQIVILASIIQREAVTAEDMYGVASVLTNRLENGMTFGSDVTLEYALGRQKDGNWWKEDLTIDDLALNSLYNTRIYAGLPPTAISNPGIVAIQAAMNPPKTDYLYYLSDKDGKLHFARTLDEHNALIEKYLQ